MKAVYVVIDNCEKLVHVFLVGVTRPPSLFSFCFSWIRTNLFFSLFFHFHDLAWAEELKSNQELGVNVPSSGCNRWTKADSDFKRCELFMPVFSIITTVIFEWLKSSSKVHSWLCLTKSRILASRTECNKSENYVVPLSNSFRSIFMERAIFSGVLNWNVFNQLQLLVIPFKLPQAY